MKIAPRYASLPACSISVISTLEAMRTQDLLKSIIREQRSPLNVKLFSDVTQGKNPISI